MTSFNKSFNFIDVLKLVESGKTSALVAQFYKRSKEIADSEVIIRLIHRVSLSVRTIPRKFNNCAGNFDNNKNNVIIAIIGEQPASESPLQKSYPFLNISGSSGWLNSQLNKSKAREDCLFWVNALNLDGTENDPEIINQLKPKYVVCLGKIAEEWAKKNGWEFVSFPHPQYWKRFKSKLPYPLIDYLNNCVSKT